MKKQRLLIGTILMLVLVFALAAAMGDGTTVVTVSGKYDQTEARSMLKMINQFRTGSDAWYWNPDNTTKTQLKNLRELKYDDDLEAIAMQRAMECALLFNHVRPNGEICFTAVSNGVYSMGENIAVCQAKASDAFAAWREDNEKWSGQGHRRNMLSEDFTSIGIGHVVVNNTHYWVQEFGYGTGSSTSAAVNRTKDVQVEVAHDLVGTAKWADGNTNLTIEYGNTSGLPDQVLLSMKESVWPSTVCVRPEIAWSSGNPEIISFSGNTMVTNKTGTASLTGRTLGKKLSVSVKVTPADLSGGKITLSSSVYTYDGTEHIPAAAITVNGRKLTEADYTLSYQNNINAGKAGVVFKGKGNYKGTASASFTINPKDLSGAEIAEIGDVLFSGREQTPAPAVTLEGKPLTAGRDYELSYQDNLNAGTNAKLIVRGIGNYSGSASSTFTILQADLASVVWNPIMDQIYTGRPLCPAVTGKLGGAAISAENNFEVVYSNNVETGTARAAVTGRGNFYGTAELEFKITKLEFKTSGKNAIITGAEDRSVNSVTIPGSVERDGKTYKVTEIDSSAFKGWTNLKSVSIGKNVKTIGKKAFYGCTSLTTVTGGKGVTKIKDSAFCGCRALTSFPAMSKLKSIGKSAFKKCETLPKITLGSSVESIGKDAFNGCKALNSITIKTKKLTAEKIGSKAFKDTPKKATIKVPKDKLEEYRTLLREKGVNKKAKIKK